MQVEATPAPAEPFQIGDGVGRHYMIRGVLGRRGMNHLYEADDPLLRRRVAIKVVDDPTLGAPMLLHEARALAAVRHTGLPVVHELGIERGWAYLVFERLYGFTLEQRLLLGHGSQLQLGVDETVRVLLGVADVLAAVHTAGMAHRDLKPDNVMMCPAGRIVLLDFGIMVPDGAERATSRTGAAEHVAPEVLTGVVEASRAHLIDVYGFGAMGYEMLAGEVPFQSESVPASLAGQLHTAPPDIAAARTDVPRSLAAMLRGCLAKDPLDRPDSMEVIVWELQSVLRELHQGAAPRRCAS